MLLAPMLLAPMLGLARTATTLCALTATKPFEVAHTNLAQLIAKASALASASGLPAPHTPHTPQQGVLGAARPSNHEQQKQAQRAVDAICADLVRLIPAGVPRGSAAVPDSDEATATALRTAVERVREFARQGSLQSHRVQPLLLTALCVGHYLLGVQLGHNPGPASKALPPLRALVDALLMLVCAVLPMLPCLLRIDGRIDEHTPHGPQPARDCEDGASEDGGGLMMDESDIQPLHDMDAPAPMGAGG